MRQSSNLIHSLIFAFFNRNSMRWRLFGFPDESPHAIPGPDDFCITRMMRPGLMELSVSGGIRLHSPKLVDKIRLCPLTQSTGKLLTQQSWEEQRQAERRWRRRERERDGKKNVGENQSEKNKMSTERKSKEQEMERQILSLWLFCMLTKSQEMVLRAFFFLFGSLLFPLSHFI